MNIYGPEALEGLRVEILDPRRLSRVQTKEVLSLFQTSMQAEFGLQNGEVKKVRKDVQRRIERLKTPMPGGAGADGKPRGLQQVYDPRLVAFIDTERDNMVACQIAGGNVSSRFSNPLVARLEMLAKRALSPQHTYNTLGLRALAPKIEEQYASNFEPGTINLIDLAVATALFARPDRTLTTYPWIKRNDKTDDIIGGEQAYTHALNALGFYIVGGAVTINPLPGSAAFEKVVQEKWQADSTGEVLERIWQKEGAGPAMDLLRNLVEVYTESGA